MSNRERILVAILAIGAFASAINATLIVPLLKSIAGEFEVTEAATGQLTTIYSLTVGVTALFVSSSLDRYARGNLLRVGAFVVALGVVIMVAAPGLPWLFAGRFVAGLGGAVILPSCIAAVSDLFVDPNQRNRGLGIIWAATSASLLLGFPLLAQVNAWLNWGWATASVLLPLMLLFAGTWLIPSGRRQTRTRASLLPLNVFSHAPTVWLLGATAIFWVVFFGSFNYLGAFLETDFAASAGALSLIFLVSGSADVIATYLAPNFIRWTSARTTFIACVSIYAVNLIGVGFLYTTLESMYVYGIMAGAASGAFGVIGSVLLLDSLPSARGAVMALQSAVISLGGALGSALAGGILALQGYAAAYVTLGIILPLALLFFWLSGRYATAMTAQPVAGSSRSSDARDPS